jgi:hypothetical protein
MFKITPNPQWKKFNSIYGSKDILDRYTWFLFEFGKRATKLFYKNLLQRISGLEGSTVYKKSLILAELRDKTRKSWWAVVSSAKPIGDAKYDPKTSIFTVVSRFPTRINDDPIEDILETHGPWTVETIPFIPSPRAGQVVLKTVTEDLVEKTKERNIRQGALIKAKMIRHGIEFTPRFMVYQKLRVIRDIEAEALRIEFGLVKKSKPHWRPSLRWIKKEGMKRLEKDDQLIRLWLDPRYTRYRLIRHYRIKLTQDEVKRMEKFQQKIR